MNNKIFVTVVLLLAAFAALTIYAYLPKASSNIPEAQMANFPMSIGEWQGKDIPLRELDYAILETKNLIVREYKAPDKPPVYLYIIYSADNRKSLHPPEICYTGGGSTILKKTVIPLTEAIKANIFTIDYRDSKQLVAYWFRANNVNTSGYLQQQFKVMLERTLGKRVSGAMMRISVDITRGKEQESLDALNAFCRQIEPLLLRYVQ